MSRVPSVAQTQPSLRPLANVARKLAVTGRACATCGSTEIRPSNRRNALDILLACLFLAPFRCRHCRSRFYRVWRPSLLRPPEPPVAPLLIIPARRDVPDVHNIPTYRIEPQPHHSQRNQPQLVPAAMKPSVQVEVPKVKPPEIAATPPAGAPGKRSRRHIDSRKRPLHPQTAAPSAGAPRVISSWTLRKPTTCSLSCVLATRICSSSM